MLLSTHPTLPQAGEVIEIVHLLHPVVRPIFTGVASRPVGGGTITLPRLIPYNGETGKYRKKSSILRLYTPVL